MAGLSSREDRLFLCPAPTAFKDETVEFRGRAGFLRRGGSAPLRLMVVDGEITGGGITLTSAEPASLIYDGKAVTVQAAADAKPEVKLGPALAGVPVNRAEVTD